MFFATVKKSEKELEKLSDYERQRLKNIAEIELQVRLSELSVKHSSTIYLLCQSLIDFFPQLADPLDIIQQSANELKSSNITAKRRAKSKKSKFNSETGEETSNSVKFVRRSSRIIQEKRYEVIYFI